MRLVFAEQAWDGCLFWQRIDPKITRRIHDLIKDAARHPFEGIGKPEPLRHALAGYGSRRITGEHRMVYKAVANDLLIAQLKDHH